MPAASDPLSERGLKRAKTALLENAFLEDGPGDGWPVLLAHGLPYDVHAYDEVSQILAQAGARAIVP